MNTQLFKSTERCKANFVCLVLKLCDSMGNEGAIGFCKIQLMHPIQEFNIQK